MVNFIPFTFANSLFMIAIQTYWQDLLGLFYPHLCPACWLNQPPQGELLCTKCSFHLPQTNYHLEAQNPFTERFWGRLPLETGAALFHFNKGGKTQRLIHQLKYKGRKDIGIRLGERYGHYLNKVSHFQEIERIIPVPLHPKKLWLRGYNQSAAITEGLSQSMGIPHLPHGLQRVNHAETQTRKSRMERMNNVLNNFVVNQPGEIAGCHVLLVDDVMTTGATLEACGQKILELENTRLSLLTLAIAG
jgi:ComF family protein